MSRTARTGLAGWGWPRDATRGGCDPGRLWVAPPRLGKKPLFGVVSRFLTSFCVCWGLGKNQGGLVVPNVSPCPAFGWEKGGAGGADGPGATFGGYRWLPPRLPSPSPGMSCGNKDGARRDEHPLQNEPHWPHTTLG